MEAAQRIVAGRPDESNGVGALAAMIGEQHDDLWEENVGAVNVFSDMLTQWNVGPGGVVGLRYEALPIMLDLRNIPASSRGFIFEDLRVMERAALEHFRG